ncbi:ABC transporter permease [Thermoleptolyngbya sp. C42_A2020_037]|uniref:ABC transporter permease n=1 Tax=Thermoleptolyngbya sp. C42_A2020_037 TaxID=2747799 RepID=UPI0019E5F2F2|nr:ABC transporter permease [Thermoleptolyngbya sp. C42_A2020_037]MBF2087148.1 ABC transporter permease [Thermoleptolyngbya sp. C42_A2020_037]
MTATLDLPKTTVAKRRLSWQFLFTLVMFAFMYIPVLVLAFFSFNASPFSAGWSGFSLQWYQRMFNDTRILSALADSLSVALLAVGIAAVLGTLMAVGLARYTFPGKQLYQGVSYLPLIIPDIAIAVATLVFLASLAIPLSLWTVVAAHIVFCLAYIAVVVSTRLTGMNPHLEEAALDLGATPFQAFIKVLLPQLMPAIISGCLLAFVLSMDDLLISSFTAGGGTTTLPMEIFSRVRTGVKPDINALSVVLILASGTLAFAAEFIRYRSEQQRLDG